MTGPGERPPPEVVELPVDGTLDLHSFAPSEVKGLVTDYLELCREKGIFEVLLIHGKGTGALRETVHSLLRTLPGIDGFGLAREELGGWGATVVRLGGNPAPFRGKSIPK